MSDYSSINDFQKLAELLNPQKNENSDSEDEAPYSNSNKGLTPGDLGKTPTVSASKTKYKKIEEQPKKDEVVDPEEAFLENSETEISWKKTPEWNLVYKQHVTPQDVFLQMGGKTPSTASCEDMVITVDLPGEKRQNIDLKITKNRLDLVSPRFRLNIPLPHPVDPQQGNAEFDSSADKIRITLRMDREFDYINF